MEYYDPFTEEEQNKGRYDRLVVDTNNLFHKSYHKLNHMTVQVKKATITTGGIYGSMKSIRALERDRLKGDNTTTIHFLFDNAKSKEELRKAVDPAYKLNRKPMPKQFYRSLDYFRYMLMNYSNKYEVIHNTGYEADDIAPIVLSRIPEDESVLLVSDDMDWSRLIGYGGRTIHHLSNGKVYDEKVFEDRFGFKPTEDNVVLYKTIRGDTIDNIPVGVKGLPKDKLLRLIDDYTDIFDVYENLEIIDYLSEKWKRETRDNFPRLQLNHKLVSFLDLEEGDISEHTFRCQYKPSTLKLLYETLQFDIGSFDNRLLSVVQERQERQKQFVSDVDESMRYPKERRV